MHIYIVGVSHEVQWKDPSGDFREFLSDLMTTSGSQLVAEEAYSLPTTVGQRIACRVDVPWMALDLSRAERADTRASEELEMRASWPLFGGDGNPVGYAEEYLPGVDGVREDEWVGRIRKYRVDSVTVVCGALHVAPLAEKLRVSGYSVQEIEAWKLAWYTALYGALTIVEQDGRRWAEIRR